MNITRCAKNIKSNQFRNHVKIIRQSKKRSKIFCSSEYYKQVVLYFSHNYESILNAKNIIPELKEVIPFIDLN